MSNDHDQALARAFDVQAPRFERAPSRAIRPHWSGWSGSPDFRLEAGFWTRDAVRAWSPKPCSQPGTAWSVWTCRGR